MHEAKDHEFSTFITLTYSNEHIPEDYGLHKEHFQLFMKRLRMHFYRTYPPTREKPEGHLLRFYACGEYGENTRRPHYHAVVFNCAFPDQVLFKGNADPGRNIYTSKTLEDIWGMGYVTCSHVTYANAAYVASYVRKKMTDAKHYERVNPITGELFKVEPEFSLMSRRPGLGRAFIERNLNDVYPDDFLIVDGHKSRVPRFYDKVLAERDASGMETVRAKRKEAAQLPAVKFNNSKSRLEVREEIARQKLTLKKRTL